MSNWWNTTAYVKNKVESIFLVPEDLLHPPLMSLSAVTLWVTLDVVYFFFFFLQSSGLALHSLTPTSWTQYVNMIKTDTAEPEISPF